MNPEELADVSKVEIWRNPFFEADSLKDVELAWKMHHEKLATEA